MIRWLLILSLLLQPMAWVMPVCAARTPAPERSESCCCCGDVPDAGGACGCEAAPPRAPEKAPDQAPAPQDAKFAVPPIAGRSAMSALVGPDRFDPGAPRRWISHRFDRPLWCVWLT